MEELEISSWVTLDAIKKSAEVVETIGNLQSDHSMSVFCRVEEDLLELVYSDTTSNALRRYENQEEFDEALEERKEDGGEAPYDEEDVEFNEDEEEEDEEEAEQEETLEVEDESEERF